MSKLVDKEKEKIFKEADIEANVKFIKRNIWPAIDESEIRAVVVNGLNDLATIKVRKAHECK